MRDWNSSFMSGKRVFAELRGKRILVSECTFTDNSWESSGYGSIKRMPGTTVEISGYDENDVFVKEVVKEWEVVFSVEKSEEEINQDLGSLREVW